MDSRTIKRLIKELENINNDPLPFCSAEPISESNLLEWKASIIGPNDTPYENGTFHLSISFSLDYPFKPPKILFITKIYHPNISSSGAICLDILKDSWSPALTINKILLSICSLLSDPNPNDPLMTDIAKLYINNFDLFFKNAKEYTEKYAFSN